MGTRTFEEALPIWRETVIRETGRDPYPDDRAMRVLLGNASHSALLAWLMAGNDPLPEPPPVLFSSPCHSMVVQGHREGWFDAWLDDRGHVYLGQRPWAIIRELPDGSRLVRPTRSVERDGEWIHEPYGDVWRLSGPPVREFGEPGDFDQIHTLRLVRPPSGRVAALFRGPFRREPGTGYVYDADGDTAVTDFLQGEGPIARGWGRIQYMADADALMGEWDAYFKALVGDEDDLDVIAALLEYAWPAGVAKNMERSNGARFKRREVRPTPLTRGGIRSTLAAAMAIAGLPVAPAGPRGCKACADLRACTGRSIQCAYCKRGKA